MASLEHLLAAGNGDFPTAPDHPKELVELPVVLDPKNLAHPGAPLVSPLLWSGFIEHLGRCIYGGIVDDYRNPSPAELLIQQGKGRPAWRSDILKLLASDGDLQVPMIRWPGGNFVSNYHWQDGIGPIESRPKRTELAWLDMEPNTFGTDEYIDWCRVAKVEPYICLNMGTGTYEEALAWVEYCNGKGDTRWANLRRKNTGRDEPHDVKYWGLGNEMWGPWQIGNLSATDYAKKAKQWAHGLKLLDPSIKLVGCGNTVSGRLGSTDWDREILLATINCVDYHSIHFYSTHGEHQHSNVAGYEYEKNVFGPATAERNIQVCKSLIDLANIENSYRKIPARDVKVCFDEWNVWDDTKGSAFDSGGEQQYDFTDMLGFCAWCNLLVRQSNISPIACMAQSVNVLSPILTKPDGFIKQTLYHPLRLFSRYMKNGRMLQLPRMPQGYKGPTYPVWIQQIDLQPEYIDISAIIVEDGSKASIRLSILNRHPEVDWHANTEFRGFNIDQVEIHEIYHDELDAKNTFDNPENVVPTITKMSGEKWRKTSKRVVKKHSWSFYIFDGSVA